MDVFPIIILVIFFFIFKSLFSTKSKYYFHKDSTYNELLRIERNNEDLLSSVTNIHRGTISERNLVLKLLDLNFDARAIFHDIYIKKLNNNYTQIDLVLATKVGIFVFEVKDYSGWLFGNASNKFWTQVLSYGKEKHRFYNPIKQNESHIKALKSQLEGIGNIPFYSIIVFYGNCEMKEISNIPENTFVCYAFDVKNVVNNILGSASNAHYLNKQKVMEVLQEGVKNGENLEIIEEHITNVKQNTPQISKITQYTKSSYHNKVSKPINVFRVIRRLQKWR